MFSFFRRNKPRPQEVTNNSSNSNNNDQNAGNVVTPPTKLSVNMQLAIERQQASLAAVLEQKRSQNDVNGREQKEHVKNEENKNPPVTNYRSPTTSAIVNENEYDRSNALSNLSASARALQNYDQHRDSKRVTYSPYDLFVSSRQTSNAPSHNLVNNSASNHLTTRSIASSPSSPPINEQQKLENLTNFVGTGSTVSSTQFNEVMARGRNKNRNNRASNFSNNINNNNKSNVKNNKNSGDDNKVQKDALEESCSTQVNNANENKITRNENVLHATHSSHASDDDENSCSINSTTDNTNDNITVVASDEKTVKIPSRVFASVDDTSVNGGGDDDDEKNCAAASYEKEHVHQQVRRVTFAPSPPITTTRSRTASLTSLSDGGNDEQQEEDEEETISEDIFYEAPTTISESNDTQKLRILSTVTSTQSCNHEEASNSSIMTLTKTTSNNDGNNNDVVCAKIILSVNENCNENDSNDDIAFSTSSNRGNEINSEENSISNDNDEKEISTPLKTIKSSYKLVGDEAVALPDILDSALPDILCEQQSHHNIDANV